MVDNMKIYIAECYDRHIDPVIEVFVSLEAAVEYSKAFVRDNARHPDDIEEQNVNFALYYCRYSCEGDRVLVEEKTLNGL